MEGERGKVPGEVRVDEGEGTGGVAEGIEEGEMGVVVSNVVNPPLERLDLRDGVQCHAMSRKKGWKNENEQM